MDYKKCPLCKETKSVDEFHKYYSKERQKYRVGNYCIPCANSNANRRTKEYYSEHAEQRKDYARRYRLENKEKVRKRCARIKKIYKEKLQDCYVAELAANALKCPIKEIRDTPGLLEAYKNNVKLKRKIRNYGKKQTD